MIQTEGSNFKRQKDRIIMRSVLMDEIQTAMERGAGPDQSFPDSFAVVAA